MEEVTRDAAGIEQLILAWQRSRSIASEGGYLDLLVPHHGLPGLDWAIGDERTLDMLMDYQSGKKPLDDNNWMNLCWVVNFSASWTASLAIRGYEMPDFHAADFGVEEVEA